MSALNGIWAQRLIRMNCPRCAVQYTPDDAELASAHLARADVHDYQFMRGLGCGDCRGTGYKGRRSIAEILTLNDEIRELIVDKQPIRRIKAAAAANGTRSLRLAALLRLPARHPAASSTGLTRTAQAFGLAPSSRPPGGT